jgi:hypothetical protein
MRPLGPVVLVAALLAAGCGGYRKPEVTAKDRMECDAYARSIARPGSDHYKGIYARCIYGIQHPERGGG